MPAVFYYTDNPPITGSLWGVNWYPNETDQNGGFTYENADGSYQKRVVAGPNWNRMYPSFEQTAMAENEYRRVSRCFVKRLFKKHGIALEVPK